MEYSEKHVGKMETQLKQWGKKLDKLTARAEKAGTEARSDYRKGIDDLKAKYRVTQFKLSEFRAGGSGSWDTFKTGFESAWNEFDAAFKKLTTESKGGGMMLWTIAIICFLLWALGLATSVTLGGYIHVLVGLAVVLFTIRIILGSHRAVKPKVVD